MIIQHPVNADFSEVALDDMRLLLRAPRLCDLVVYVGDSWSTRARQLQGQHGFDLRIFPDHMLKTRFMWGASYLADYVWNPGID